MNVALFKSKHAFGALVLSAAAVALVVQDGAPLGARAGRSTTTVLWTGWTALVAMLAVAAYSLRKYVHRVAWSPEFRLRASTRALERAETRLSTLRADILRGAVRDRSDVERIAGRILREEGVGRVVRANVEAATSGGPWRVRILPTEPLGRVSTWLHVHAWYGLAAGLLVCLHGGFGCGSPLGLTLNVLTVATVTTGVVGLLLWAVGPRIMTARERDFTFEDAFVQNRSLKRKIAEAESRLDPAAAPLFKAAAAAPREGFAAAARDATSRAAELPPPVRAALADLLALAGQRRRVKAELARLAPVKFWINVWRVVHVPGTALLLAASFVHAYQVWRY